MRKILTCSGCGARLSGPIRIHSTKDPAAPKPVHEMAKPICKPGEGYKSWRPMVWSESPNEKLPLQFAPQFWLNPADVTEAARDVADHRRLSGCCGRSGHNGPNQRCRACGATIGTLMDDCWTDRVFIPEPSMTVWRVET